MFPIEITRLKNLTLLHLSGNQLEDIPTEIEELQKLGKLSLKRNKFKLFPGELMKLKNLTLLDLSMNQLETLPDEIGNLQALYGLYLSNNKLKSLPRSIKNLSNISIFNLRNNEFDDLPQTTRNWSLNLNIMSLWFWFKGYESLDSEIEEDTLGKKELKEIFKNRILF